MEITECLTWHIEGKILDSKLEPESTNPLYFVNPDEALKIKKKTEGLWRFKQENTRKEGREGQDSEILQKEAQKMALSDRETKGSDDESDTEIEKNQTETKDSNMFKNRG